jgi:hypothetical protein
MTLDQTWLSIGDATYGARPDQRGPIGGGPGYGNTIAGGSSAVTDLESLVAALAAAAAGQVVFIPGETEIDLTTFVYMDDFVLEVPAGVTLAGARGNQGSQGALLTSDALKTPAMIRALGPGVRITGLRVRGPNSKRYLDHHGRSFSAGGGGHEYYYRFPTQNGIVTETDDLEVDNCEISGFGHSAVKLTQGTGHHIHHSYIHHCQYQGLGYGVSHGPASSLVEMNLFDWNRHSIAGSGSPGCQYAARHNVELGTSLSHCFDMHGGRDRKDGTDIAGSSIEISNNTFRAPQRAIGIRGVPQDTCQVHHNWFVSHEDPAAAVRAAEKTEVHANAYGADTPAVQ